MSVAAAGERTQPGGVRKRAVVAAVIGNFIEWYDFTL
jgi:MHS family proline/betaine transporter-like MFS transporter